ncbi:MAG TPA: hypothetical protein VGN83_20345 [Falsiroseomonas sp.]|nr:hypothetical protein [Falsiroseomonas sp.]
MLIAGVVATGGALLAASPATAQTADRSTDRGQFGWYEDRDWTTRAPFRRGYEQGRMDERRNQFEVFGQGQFGWFEDRDWTTREPFRRGYEQGRMDERRNRLEVFGQGQRGWFEEDERTGGN